MVEVADDLHVLPRNRRDRVRDSHQIATFVTPGRDSGSVLVINGTLSNGFHCVPNLFINGVPVGRKRGALSTLTVETTVGGAQAPLARAMVDSMFGTTINAAL